VFPKYIESIIKSKSEFGIEGYRVPKFGLEYKYPNYTVPKDEKMSYFKHVTNHTEGKPDMRKHYTELSWKTPNGNFGKGDKRKTFTDIA
jgi:hypothetical protein